MQERFPMDKQYILKVEKNICMNNVVLHLVQQYYSIHFSMQKSSHV